MIARITACSDINPTVSADIGIEEQSENQ